MRKRELVDCGLSGFVTCAISLFGFDNVAMYGSDLIDMTSHGKLLFLLPLMLSPIAFILALRLLKLLRAKNKLRITFIYVLIYLAITFVPSVATSALSTFELDSIEISRDNLNNAEIQKLQSLEMSRSAFPFLVRFHWQSEEIRVVFKRSNGRNRIVKEILSAALAGHE